MSLQSDSDAFFAFVQSKPITSAQLDAWQFVPVDDSGQLVQTWNRVLAWQLATYGGQVLAPPGSYGWGQGVYGRYIFSITQVGPDSFQLSGANFVQITQRDSGWFNENAGIIVAALGLAIIGAGAYAAIADTAGAGAATTASAVSDYATAAEIIGPEASTLGAGGASTIGGGITSTSATTVAFTDYAATAADLIGPEASVLGQGGASTIGGGITATSPVSTVIGSAVSSGAQSAVGQALTNAGTQLVRNALPALVSDALAPSTTPAPAANLAGLVGQGSLVPLAIVALLAWKFLL